MKTVTVYRGNGKKVVPVEEKEKPGRTIQNQKKDPDQEKKE